MSSLPDWDLGQLYEIDGADLRKAMEVLEAEVRAFAGRRDGLRDDLPLGEFEDLLGEYERIARLCHLLGGYAGLYFSQNTQDQKAQSFMARVDDLMAELTNQLLFFELWWKDLPDEAASRLSSGAEGFQYWLGRLRALRDHTLSEKEERVINVKNTTGSEALTALYDSVCGRYRFPVDFLPGEEARKVSREELMVYARSPRAEVRKAAYRALYKVYGDDGPILGQIYQTRVRDWRQEYVKLRNYESPIMARHKANDLSAETVESLLAVCREKACVFREIFEMKAKALKLDSFTRYDLYAPLSSSEESFTFDEAKAEVFQAFQNFSPLFKDLAGKIVDDRRFSAALTPGKQGGAFCASLNPGDTPWILMSFTGRRNDLFTMAHEMGHGIHSQLARNHSAFHFHATLPLAETASTFGEMLLARHFLEKSTDGKTTADLLLHLLDDAYATVCRQAFFAMFEIKAHEMIDGGATSEDLASVYHDDLKAQFGPKVEVAPEFRWEWVSIPHFFHTPFYVYAYSFGQLLVYSLWRRYEKEGSDFVPKLISILSKGGSEAPENILKEAGIPRLDEDFWRGGFEVISSFVERLSANLGS